MAQSEEPTPVYGTIKAQFDADFRAWKIRLPARDLKARRPGRIFKAGWAIAYVFGSDEQGGYLDYYASHRMTEDDHVRLRDGVGRESLPAIFGWRMVSPDPEEDARWAAEHIAKNREVERMLEAKGLGMTGDEPGGVLMNRFLRLGGADESDTNDESNESDK
jgi:hypothetical protein